MNTFLKKGKILDQRPLLAKSYGLSRRLLGLHLGKYRFSSLSLTRRSSRALEEKLIRGSHLFNRLLKLRRKKQVEEVKKQSSWKSLRFRQGLPANGQRTHTNSAVAKKLNNRMYSYDI